MTRRCPYCDSAVKRVTGKTVYPRRPDLHKRPYYACERFPECDAYVGCHPGTAVPLGRLADKELRQAKNAAHRAFDPIWKDGRMRRHEAYQWLAGQLGIDRAECHIGMFDVEMCRRVVDACRQRSAA